MKVARFRPPRIVALLLMFAGVLDSGQLTQTKRRRRFAAWWVLVREYVAEGLAYSIDTWPAVATPHRGEWGVIGPPDQADIPTCADASAPRCIGPTTPAEAVRDATLKVSVAEMVLILEQAAAAISAREPAGLRWVLGRHNAACAACWCDIVEAEVWRAARSVRVAASSKDAAPRTRPQASRAEEVGGGEKAGVLAGGTA